MFSVPASFDLARGERLLWSGAPRTGVVLQRSDAFLIPFSLLWAGFAVFWEASVVTTGAPTFFVLWGVPFVLMGAYVTVGRFWYDAWRRARTRYGLTTERVLIASGGVSPTLTSLDLRTLTDVTLTTRADGSGTITFGRVAGVPSFFAGSGWPGVKGPPAFELIPSARRVYDLVREAQRTSTVGTAA